MKLFKAMEIAQKGPKTEAQRQQAIKTLRSFAHSIRHEDAMLAATARDKANRLLELGDINLIKE